MVTEQGQHYTYPGASIFGSIYLCLYWTYHQDLWRTSFCSEGISTPHPNAGIFVDSLTAANVFDNVCDV